VRAFTWAEGQAIRDNYSDILKRKWLKVRCPSCHYLVENDPKTNWSGTLKCPECGKNFKVPSLDGFIEEEVK